MVRLLRARSQERPLPQAGELRDKSCAIQTHEEERKRADNETAKLIEQKTTRNIRLFGLEVHDTHLSDAAKWIIERAVEGKLTHISFLNAHCVNVLSRNADYRRVLEESDRVYADGIGVRIAARLAGIKLMDNVNGTDLLPVLCEEAAKSGVSLYFLGSQSGVAAAAARKMEECYPAVKIAGTQPGYFENEADEKRAVKAINRSGADIILVGMGVPVQEVWLARNRCRLNPNVVMGVGGLFDYYSGRIPRAPLKIRKAGFEWAWRLGMEPRRLARRYVIGNAEFLGRLVWRRLRCPADFGQSSAPRS